MGFFLNAKQIIEVLRKFIELLLCPRHCALMHNFYIVGSIIDHKYRKGNWVTEVFIDHTNTENPKSKCELDSSSSSTAQTLLKGQNLRPHPRLSLLKRPPGELHFVIFYSFVYCGSYLLCKHFLNTPEECYVTTVFAASAWSIFSETVKSPALSPVTEWW